MYLYKAIELLSNKLIGGATKPWKVRALREDKKVVTVVVKLYDGHKIDQYQPVAKELYGCRLASQFGLRSPNCGLISFEADFLSTLGKEDLKRLKPIVSGLLFATEWIQSAPLVDLKNINRRTFSEYEIPLVYAYDHLIWNTDRRLIKPNLLANEEEFILIDHEMCFPNSNSGYIKVWEDKQEWGYPSENHLFFSMLKAKRREKKLELFNEFEEYLRNFSFNQLDEIDNFIQENKVECRNFGLIQDHFRILKRDSAKFCNRLRWKLV